MWIGSFGELSRPELDNWQKNFSKSLSGAMVYITEWDKFVEQSIQLFRADPDSTRYVMKYRHCDGKLVLKVTDNRQWRTNGPRKPSSKSRATKQRVCNLKHIIKRVAVVHAMHFGGLWVIEWLVLRLGFYGLRFTEAQNEKET
ncbi:hypothetical protein V8G54_022106 [Vigna mungo]|uniref:SRP9 domain-containing protein n=1 Tax=Vigna mungo TaxID=3915 RepID=A0AAQ3NED7_VIGMU